MSHYTAAYFAHHPADGAAMTEPVSMAIESQKGQRSKAVRFASPLQCLQPRTAESQSAFLCAASAPPRCPPKQPANEVVALSAPRRALRAPLPGQAGRGGATIAECSDVAALPWK